MSFEKNLGQAGPETYFTARGRGYTLDLHRDGVSLALQSPSGGRAKLGIRPIAAKPLPPGAVSGEEKLPGVSNYLLGLDRSRWIENAPNYSRVRYREVYPGIDLVYYGNAQRLEYDFDIAPGRDPARIALEFTGVERVEIDSHGELILHAGRGAVRQPKPVAYQIIAGRRRDVNVAYRLTGRRQIAFQVGEYDQSANLVIDLYSSYFGSTAADQGTGVAVTQMGISMSRA